VTDDRPRLLLVGAGHVHLEILRRFATTGPRPFETTIVSIEERHFYSGMTPGYLAGQYTVDDLTSHVPSVARQAGATCVVGRATALDPGSRLVRLDDGREIEYDLASLNIGSLLLGAGTEVARHAELIKPLHRAERLKQRIADLASSDSRPTVPMVIVGAGAAGIEIAFAVAAVLDHARRDREIVIVDAGDHILSGYEERPQHPGHPRAACRKGRDGRGEPR
jgi:NADH dehydrogenase FAD-containing subunit